MGRRYSVAFSAWTKQHGFGEMQKGVRSAALDLHANIEAIETWRATLPERQRKRLVHPLSNVRRWRAATSRQDGCRADPQACALKHWARFVACLSALPEDQAAYLWRLVSAEIEAQQTPNYAEMWRVATTHHIPAHACKPVGRPVGTDTPPE
jgi:hypothetical protein